MIPSPETPRESAECCLEVLNISMLDNVRLANIFVDSLEHYLTRLVLNVEDVRPEDPEELDAYNRLCNRTFGFVKLQAIQKPETALRMYAVLAQMRQEISWRNGADQLHHALCTIADGGRDQSNTMLRLIRDLRKI